MICIIKKFTSIFARIVPPYLERPNGKHWQEKEEERNIQEKEKNQEEEKSANFKFRYLSFENWVLEQRFATLSYFKLPSIKTIVSCNFLTTKIFLEIHMCVRCLKLKCLKKYEVKVIWNINPGGLKLNIFVFGQEIQFNCLPNCMTKKYGTVQPSLPCNCLMSLHYNAVKCSSVQCSLMQYTKSRAARCSAVLSMDKRRVGSPIWPGWNSPIHQHFLQTSLQPILLLPGHKLSCFKVAT